MRGEIDKSMNAFGDLPHLNSTFDATTIQKINKDIEDLNNTISQQDLTDSNRTCHTNSTIHFRQVLTEHNTKIAMSDRKQISTTRKELKSHKMCSLTTTGSN